MPYRLTRRAETDLIAIYRESLRRHGRAQAEAYVTRLERVMALLGEQPLMARERTELTPPVRIHPCGVHIVIYVLDGDGILVVRLRHGREDWLTDPL